MCLVMACEEHGSSLIPQRINKSKIKGNYPGVNDLVFIYPLYQKVMPIVGSYLRISEEIWLLCTLLRDNVPRAVVATRMEKKIFFLIHQI